MGSTRRVLVSAGAWWTRKWRAVLVFFAAAFLSGASCAGAQAPAEPGPSDDAIRILFIGNSLTYSNDLPRMLRSLLLQAGVDGATVASIARPNAGLQDHWSQEFTHERIAEGWDVVVLQQGPSATEGRPSLLDYSQRFAEPIRAAGAIPALYMVWPAEARSFDFPGVSAAYSDAADLVEGLLFPAGEAWLDAWELDSTLPLYDGDRFHPSPLGSYLAALVMYEQLTGNDPRELSSDIPGFGGIVPDAQLALLRDAARSANSEHRRTPR